MRSVCVCNSCCSRYLYRSVVGELVKWTAGRGRPFVGGHANAFNFAPFAATEAHASFPSAHAITAFALALAIAAIWPRWRGLMIAYALLIAVTRLLLLAHHPSDVVAGATIGIIGAMGVRYWFAGRGLGFSIGDGGVISPVTEGPLKGVAAGHRPHKKRTVGRSRPTPTGETCLPPTHRIAVSIVVPVRNEAENIAPVIAEIAAALDGRWNYEIIYVNDGSTDATAERLESAMKERKNLRQLRHAVSTDNPPRCVAAFALHVARLWRRWMAMVRTIRFSCRR